MEDLLIHNSSETFMMKFIRKLASFNYKKSTDSGNSGPGEYLIEEVALWFDKGPQKSIELPEINLKKI
jgi:hypothetical protein